MSDIPTGYESLDKKITETINILDNLLSSLSDNLSDNGEIKADIVTQALETEVVIEDAVIDRDDKNKILKPAIVYKVEDLISTQDLTVMLTEFNSAAKNVVTAIKDTLVDYQNNPSNSQGYRDAIKLTCELITNAENKPHTKLNSSIPDIFGIGINTTTGEHLSNTTLMKNRRITEPIQGIISNHISDISLTPNGDSLTHQQLDTLKDLYFKLMNGEVSLNNIKDADESDKFVQLLTSDDINDLISDFTTFTQIVRAIALIATEDTCFDFYANMIANPITLIPMWPLIIKSAIAKRKKAEAASTA